MKKEYKVSEEFLDDLISKSSKSLVGIVMKRFEVLEDKEAIKASVKELIYENYRNFKELLKSFSFGVKFISKPKDKK